MWNFTFIRNFFRKELYPFLGGGLVSPKDYRDVRLDDLVGTGTGITRPRLNLAPLKVFDQRKTPACIGHAGALYKQVLDLIETNQIAKLSPRFIYAMAKKIDNRREEGTFYKLGVHIPYKWGVMTEEYVPNDTTLDHRRYINLTALNLPDKAWQEAKQYAIRSYAKVGETWKITKEDLLRGMQIGNGVKLGVRLGREWWTNKRGEGSNKPEDILPIRPPRTIISGHDIFCYDWGEDSRGTKIWFRNSFGSDWGLKGDGFFYFEEYQKHLIEAWTAVDLPNGWVKELKEMPPANQFNYFFNRDIEMGEQSEVVRKLQIALKIDGVFPAKIVETGFYGEITRKAVYTFQLKYRVASLRELQSVEGKRVGLKTRMRLNALFAGR